MEKKIDQRVIRNLFNTLVNATANIQETAEILSEKITEEKKENPILETRTNATLSDKIQDIAKNGEYIHSKEFIANNIEHLHPRTLKKLFKKERQKNPTDPNAILVRQAPTKRTPMNPYDATVILRLLVRGVSPQKVLERYPQYTIRQVKRVKEEFWETRTENMPQDMHSALTRLEGRGQWG